MNHLLLSKKTVRAYQDACLADDILKTGHGTVDSVQHYLICWHALTQIDLLDWSREHRQDKDQAKEDYII